MSTETEGYYFISTNPGENRIEGLKAIMSGCFREGIKLGDGYKMLDRSMFLECLLTSPNGQFIDIDRHTTSDLKPFNFYYGKETNAQHYFSDLKEVLDGAFEHIALCQKFNLNYSIEEVEDLFSQIVTKRNLIPRSCWHLFMADDSISGNELINPMSFFCL
ncbi:hypothetical protein C4K68_25370 [Pokkaliibacter plantistimulans]|uniref:Uncharacterized protein n=2 Tax=Pseudomonadota TaxID=1224 RepID=A0A2S5KJW7_9PROT|nr:hypothetical protein C4K68_25370 [Pokkaliibacter plantistimulans]